MSTHSSETDAIIPLKFTDHFEQSNADCYRLSNVVFDSKNARMCPTESITMLRVHYVYIRHSKYCIVAILVTDKNLYYLGCSLITTTPNTTITGNCQQI